MNRVNFVAQLGRGQTDRQTDRQTEKGKKGRKIKKN